MDLFRIILYFIEFNQSLCVCSWLFFSQVRLLFSFFIFSWGVIIQTRSCCVFLLLKKAPKITNQGELDHSKQKYCHLLKNKTKHTILRLKWAHLVQVSPSVLYRLQMSRPVASTGHGKLSFWVSGFFPTDCLHCSPWKNCLRTAVLSCALSATIAVMKMGLAMRELREV